MKVVLKDGAPRSSGVVEVNVSKNGNTLEIGAVGVDPSPIVLEYYSGKLTLRLFGEDGQPTVVQQVKITPAAKTEPTALSEARSQASPVTPPVKTETTQEAVNSVFTAPPPAAEFDEAAFDAA